MGHRRICGDVFVLKLDEARCEAEQDEDLKFQNAVYKDVPIRLANKVNNYLLGEMLRPRDWKGFPPFSNIARLGFDRDLYREREEKMLREEKQRKMEEVEMAQRKEAEMRGETKKWEKNHRIRKQRREKREMMEREREEREREEQEREEREWELEREEWERVERVREEQESKLANTAEALVGLPYK